MLKDKINNKLSTIGDGIDEIISDGKLHKSSWLLGRCVNAAKVTSTAGSTNTYAQDLENKIRQSVVQEVEANMNKKVDERVDAQVEKKVQEVLKRLSEANPGISINIQSLCTTHETD